MEMPQFLMSEKCGTCGICGGCLICGPTKAAVASMVCLAGLVYL